MNYTEKEQKGIDKVERMNKMFDRVVMPAIGVLIILLLLSFIVGKLTDKFGGGHDAAGDAAVGSVVSDGDVQKIFSMRTALLADYEQYAEVFAAYGYEQVEGLQDLALCKQVDEELTIWQFADSVLGDFTIVKYVPSSDEASYQMLSLTISSDKLLTVTASGEGFDYAVAFTAADFSTYQAKDKEQYRDMMKVVSMDELHSMYEIFETDIRNLAGTAGLLVLPRSVD